MIRGFTSLVFILCFLFFWSLAFAHTDKFGGPDTVRISVSQEESSREVLAKVFLFNDEELTAITLPLKFGEIGVEPDINLDSVIFKGTRVDYFQWQSAWIDSAENKVKIGLISALVSDVPALKPGSGDICTMYFTIKEDVQPTEIVLDTCFAKPTMTLQLVYVDKNKKPISFVPVFDNQKAKIVVGPAKKSK